MDVYQTAIDASLPVPPAPGAVDSATFIDCFTNTGVYCNRPEKRYSYTETFRLDAAGAAIASAKVGVSYGFDKMVAEYDPVAACMDQEYLDLSTDPFETAPQAWAGLARGQRLCTRFRDLHDTTAGASWAFEMPGGVMVPFCVPC